MELILDFVDFLFEIHFSISEAGDGFLKSKERYHCHSGLVDLVVEVFEILLAVFGRVDFDWSVFWTFVHFLF